MEDVVVLSQEGRDVLFIPGWSGEPSLGSDAAEIAFVDPSEVEIGFDHEKVISDARSLVS
jgi:hypothetical protein